MVATTRVESTCTLAPITWYEASRPHVNQTCYCRPGWRSAVSLAPCVGLVIQIWMQTMGGHVSGHVGIRLPVLHSGHPEADQAMPDTNTLEQLPSVIPRRTFQLRTGPPILKYGGIDLGMISALDVSAYGPQSFDYELPRKDSLLGILKDWSHRSRA